jgi:hypothetical protein
VEHYWNRYEWELIMFVTVLISYYCISFYSETCIYSFSHLQGLRWVSLVLLYPSLIFRSLLFIWVCNLPILSFLLTSIGAPILFHWLVMGILLGSAVGPIGLSLFWQSLSPNNMFYSTFFGIDSLMPFFRFVKISTFFFVSYQLGLFVGLFAWIYTAYTSVGVVSTASLNHEFPMVFLSFCFCILLFIVLIPSCLAMLVLCFRPSFSHWHGAFCFLTISISAFCKVFLHLNMCHCRFFFFFFFACFSRVYFCSWTILWFFANS